MVKTVFEDTGKIIKDDIEIFVSKSEIERAIKYLIEVISHEKLPNEIIFHNNGQNSIRVTLIA